MYLTLGFDEHGALLDKLGKHKLGNGCLYIKKIEDVDIEILEKLLAASFARK